MNEYLRLSFQTVRFYFIVGPVLLSRMQMYARMYLRGVGSEKTSLPKIYGTNVRTYISKKQPIANQTKN